MVQASTTAVCRAYATEENADLGGSRFVGPVEVRGARGRVWLHGRRIPTWWLFTHAGGRVTGFIWSVVWRVALWSPLYWDRTPPIDNNPDCGDIWLTHKTRRETVSWPVAKSRLISALPLAHTSVSQGEAALPVLMGVRRISLEAAKQALEKAQASGIRIQMEVPLGRKGGLTQLHLDVSSEQRDMVMRVLSGSASEVVSPR
jgi:hypothetical protein